MTWIVCLLGTLEYAEPQISLCNSRNKIWKNRSENSGKKATNLASLLPPPPHPPNKPTNQQEQKITKQKQKQTKPTIQPNNSKMQSPNTPELFYAVKFRCSVVNMEEIFRKKNNIQIWTWCSCVSYYSQNMRWILEIWIIFWKPELNETSNVVNETHSEFKIIKFI